MLVVLDEFTRRCQAIVVARRLRSDDVLQCLADLSLQARIDSRRALLSSYT